MCSFIHTEAVVRSVVSPLPAASDIAEQQTIPAVSWLYSLNFIAYAVYIPAQKTI